LIIAGLSLPDIEHGVDGPPCCRHVDMRSRGLMDRTFLPLPKPGLLASLRAGLGVGAQLLIGAFVVIIATMIAMMTAFAGLMLAAAALLLRYAGASQPARIPVRVKDQPAILQARRTPRGWTVE
jgi:hypothetical protein